MDILAFAEKRYAAKAFDPAKKLSDEQINALKSILRLSPSSINLQPWHFIFATGTDAKAKIAAACPGAMTYNAEKINDAALVVVLCAKNAVDENTVEAIVAQEAADGRYVDDTAQQARADLLNGYVGKLNQDPALAATWIDKQTYIALGNVLLAAATMGIDSVPIEGFIPETVDENFALSDKGYHAVVLAAFGYHSDKDFNAALPKSRLPATQLFSDY